MSKFNPDFWEVTVSQEKWGQFSNQDHPYYEDAEDLERRHTRSDRARELLPELQAIVMEVLTERQREVVTLYFFGELNQRQIAAQLGVSQQAVSEHLYGKVRNGRAAGGALRKLRKACAKRGVQWI